MRDDTLHPPSIDRIRRAVSAFLFAAALVCVAQDSHPPATQTDKPPAAAQAPVTSANSDSRPADPANMTKQQKIAAADNERKKQLADDSTQLLSMALALKAEVDKTTKDTLSINVIRKADEIEKLARNVKEKIKQKTGAS